MEPGGILVFKEQNLVGERIIVNFATKKEWFRKSNYAWIESGLKTLAWLIPEWGIKSIAMPPLGCGNGGLDWNKVKPMIETYLKPLEGMDIQVFEPNESVKKLLQLQNQQKPVNLTAARAMLLYAMYFYESLGEAPNLFVANKLAWFLQRKGEPLRLDFKAHHYGPRLIDGFQSAWSLEVLASVDFLHKENPDKTLEEIYLGMQSWSPRKKQLIQKKHIAIASQRLKEYQESWFDSRL